MSLTRSQIEFFVKLSEVPFSGVNRSEVARRMQELGMADGGDMSDKERIAALEEVIRRVPGYMENWDWAEDHYDILKTVPDFIFPCLILEQRWEEEQANQGKSSDG